MATVQIVTVFSYQLQTFSCCHRRCRIRAGAALLQGVPGGFPLDFPLGRPVLRSAHGKLQRVGLPCAGTTPVHWAHSQRPAARSSRPTPGSRRCDWPRDRRQCVGAHRRPCDAFVDNHESGHSFLVLSCGHRGAMRIAAVDVARWRTRPEGNELGRVLQAPASRVVEQNNMAGEGRVGTCGNKRVGVRGRR